MSFLDELRDYLAALAANPEAPTRSRRESAAWLPPLRRFFLEAEERAEHLPKSSSDFGLRITASHPGRDQFLLGLWRRLLSSICAGADSVEVHRTIEQALELWVGLPVQTSRTRRVELTDILNKSNVGVWFGREEDVSEYARELRLTRLVGETPRVVGLGRILLGLPARDSVRWLLLLEAAEASGDQDQRFLTLDALRALLLEPSVVFQSEIDEEGTFHSNERWPWTSPGVRRLVELSVVSHRTHPEEEEWSYTLEPSWRPMLEELVEERPTPWRLLAQTLLEQERSGVPRELLPAPRGPDPAVELGRHARMVAHEINNAMTPVSHALKQLYGLLEKHEPPEHWQGYRERVDRNIARVRQFASQMAVATSLAAPPMEPFDLALAVRDAVAQLNGALAERVELALGVEQVRGPRERFVLVLVNLLRNAVQSAPERAVRVRILAEEVPHGLLLHVDDDGPGIPEAEREAVFLPGVTSKRDGLGQGLALAREVVEREFEGSLRCASGDLGGARFTLALPKPTEKKG